MDVNETLFIIYREELKTFVNKWNTVFETVGYLNVPTSVCNSFLNMKDALKGVNYTIPCENRKVRGRNDKQV